VPFEVKRSKVKVIGGLHIAKRISPWTITVTLPLIKNIKIYWPLTMRPF